LTVVNALKSVLDACKSVADKLRALAGAAGNGTPLVGCSCDVSRQCSCDVSRQPPGSYISFAFA
jgi:hypothetical protein